MSETFERAELKISGAVRRPRFSELDRRIVAISTFHFSTDN